ncbi:RHS repeat domain-containing protein, partial [Streptomyces sp. NPDC057386]|uniref:RHS repeat domain-containing protein n=1 Tax=unclassified Streptomyces TaxID=2593676 RepID=UPI003625C221
LSWMVDDHHGTASMTVDATTQAITRRYTKPFGEARGTAPQAWPDDKGFLGKPADTNTGLTHIGAREYDPLIGRFISVDPILTPEDHEAINGYAYANNTPIVKSDPTGLIPAPLYPNGNCGTDCRAHEHFTMESNGRGGFKWVYHSTVTYSTTVTFSGGGSGVLLSVVNVEGGDVRRASTLLVGPDPVPEKKQRPRKYLYESPNGVCIWAMASTCEAPPEPPPAPMPDIPCAQGEAQWICDVRNSYAKTMSTIGASLVGTYAASRWAKQGVTTVYRVEGAGNQRIKILEGGYVTIKNSRKAIFLNFGVSKRADEFLAKRISQGFSDTKVKSFEVDGSFLSWLRESAVPESMAKDFPNAPLVVDVTKAVDQYMLRPEHMERFFDSIQQGSGKER